jgi:hypothetical protein
MLTRQLDPFLISEGRYEKFAEYVDCRQKVFVIIVVFSEILGIYEIQFPDVIYIIYSVRDPREMLTHRPVYCIRILNFQPRLNFTTLCLFLLSALLSFNSYTLVNILSRQQFPLALRSVIVSAVNRDITIIIHRQGSISDHKRTVRLLSDSVLLIQEPLIIEVGC